MKIGLLGFGSMGRTHAYCVSVMPYFFSEHPNAKIYGVCTRNIENAKSACEKFDLGFYTDNEDDIIYNPEIDAVDICTPNIYHYESAKKAILAGKSVYCEKPLCVTYAQARELSELAKKMGVKAQIVFNNRFLSAVIRAKQIIDSGALGRILSFDAKYLHSSATNVNKNAGWKQNSDICGGGVLFDLGSHVIDLIYYLCGEFSSVYGKAQIAYPTRRGMNGEKWQTNGDEAFYMLSTLKCGAYGTIEVSKIAVGSNDDLSFEIRGENGSLRFSLMDLNYLEYYSCATPEGAYGAERGYTKIECVNRYEAPAGIFPGIKAPIGWLRGHIGSMHAFCDAVENNKSTCPSFEDGAYVQRVLDCAYLSSRENREIIIE
ncbi:MAG: Gfo/Idh/MocA family oxidoreductase [Clostridia bacterium]|nr:Gfo/Idh/MocA family oxidoreductase [Clostridia bacterium]